MITQQQRRTSITAIAATLALASALAIGGLAGYAARGPVQPLDAATARPALQAGNPSTPGAIGSAWTQRCQSSLGADDYETCLHQGDGTAPVNVDGPRLTP